MTTIVTKTREDTVALAAELERRSKTAHDFIVEPDQIRIAVDPGEPPQLAVAPGGVYGDAVSSRYPFNDTAITQLLGKAKIPNEYGKRLHDDYPNLFRDSVETLLPANRGNVLVRTLDNRARAILSNRYRILDNYDLFFQSFQTATEVNAEITRATLTDDRFEMRFIVPSWREDLELIKDAAQRDGRLGTSGKFVPGCFVSNSETGKGGLAVYPFIQDLVCMNGQILDTTIRQIHLGGINELGFLSAEAKEAGSKAVWLQVRDLIRGVFDREAFQKMVERFRETGSLVLEDPVEAVDAVVKNNALSDLDRQAILNELIRPSHDRDPGGTVFGLISAITERAKHFEFTAPDKATDMERLGGEMLQKVPVYVKVRR